MKPTLYEMAHSPFCIPIKRIFSAYGISHDTVDIPAWDRRTLARLTDGAYYQVPILRHGETLVYETATDPLAVPHFLDQKFTDGTLFPDSCAGLHEILIEHIEEKLEGKGFKLSDPHVIENIKDIGERTMVIRHKERSFGPGCVTDWKKNARGLLETFEKALRPFEERLTHSFWLLDDKPVYADYALFGILGNFQYGGQHALSPKFTNLRRWLTALRSFTVAD